VREEMARKYGVPVEQIYDDTPLGYMFRSIAMEIGSRIGSFVTSPREEETVGSFVSRVERDLYA
jgi:hypothetical protein